MKVTAFVPIRSGSKSIKDKNIRHFYGKPLVYHVLYALQNSTQVHEIFVAIDSIEYERIINNFGFSKVNIYHRSLENATDLATTESVMLEFLNTKNISKDNIFLLVQATSPFTTSDDFDNAIKQYINSGKDSLISCVRTKRFFWNKDGMPINYDFKKRPRRQDFEGIFIENGAFYINKVSAIIRDKNRLSGNIEIYEMPEYTDLELDEPFDWEIGELIMAKIHRNKLTKDKNIKLFLSDVDGVLTDAGMYYSEKGDELKKFSSYDGMGIKMLRDKGIKVGIITSEDRQINRNRAKKLQLDFEFHGVWDKLSTIENLCKDLNIKMNDVAYIGDDINDFELLSRVGIAACPKNAMPKIKTIPGIIHLTKKGGNGAVREFCEMIINALT